MKISLKLLFATVAICSITLSSCETMPKNQPFQDDAYEREVEYDEVMETETQAIRGAGTY